MTELEEHLNKAINLILSIGVIMLIAAISGLMFLNIVGMLKFELSSVGLALIVICGLAFIVASKIMWRVISNYGTSKKRLFYVFNKDVKRLE